ncbi:hypothetical protein I3842_12G098400 [Carya illinoinensis]|uniref:Uncharacterized protein n=1 Tax=Carya illinoinensis TaxID=32201 RepID=A0A922DIX6_CARIL|nr:hypothetical protein I3842_12G098400 [Carya illinoinensis]
MLPLLQNTYRKKLEYSPNSCAHINFYFKACSKPMTLLFSLSSQDRERFLEMEWVTVVRGSTRDEAVRSQPCEMARAKLRDGGSVQKPVQRCKMPR